VKENKKYLYNGKEVDDKELLRLLEEYECETINVVCETTELGVVVRDILPNVVKNVNYKYVLAEQDATQALTTFKTNLRARIQTRISNADCAMGVVYADVNLGRTGYVTTGNITVGDNVSSDVAPRLVKRVQDALNNIFFTNIRTEEPLSTRLEIVFAKNEGGKILPEDVTVGQDAIWVVGYDENVADAARVIGEETAPSNAVVVEKQTAGEKFLLSRSDMLVIIDGKEGKIDDIIQDDVESFRVLNREEATKLFGEKGNNGAVLFNTKLFYENERTESAEKSEENTPFIKVEKMPTFQGGDLNVFRNWVQSNVKYPQEAQEKALQGRVVFSFVVEKDGSVSEFQALQSPDKVLTDEVERVFKTSPKWEPGEQRGEKVRVKYTVPIVFQIKQ
jgi:TonB family protein